MVSITKIVDEIFSYKPDCVIELEKEIPHILRKINTDLGGLEAIEKTFSILPRIKESIRERIRLYQEKDVTPHFDFSDSEKYLIGCARENPKFLCRQPIYSSLTKLKWQEFWREFEFFCEYILRLYGSKKCGVTRKSWEGGVDFYGLFEFPLANQYGGLLKSITVRVAGQGKYKEKGNSVGEGVIHRFNDEINDLRQGRGRAIPLLPNWFKNPKDPLMPLFFTNTAFSVPAIELAKEKGIILRNGEQLVEDLIQLSEDWFKLDRTGKIFFDESSFIEEFRRRAREGR